MNRTRPLEWISLGLALGAFAVAILFPAGYVAIIALSCGSIALAAAEIVFDPKRAVFLFSFVLSLPITVSILSLSSAIQGQNALVALVIALQARLYFLRSGARARDLNFADAKALRESLPEKSVVFVDMDIEGESPLKDLQAGHLIRIRPEETLPCDGQINFGSSFVEESRITGDTEPKMKNMGSFVFAASKNKNGSFIFRATTSGTDSFASRLANSMEKGFPYESLFTKSLLALECIVLAGGLAAYGLGGASLVPLLNVFLVSLGTAYVAAVWAMDSTFLTRSARQGYWWKSKDSLRKVARTNLLLSARAGVLTEGKPRLSMIHGVGTLSEDGALRLLGPLARRVENDEAFALLLEMQTRNIRLEMVEEYAQTPGGAKGMVTGESVRWVDLETARVEELPIAQVEAFLAERHQAGEKNHLLFCNGQVAAAFSFSDRVYPTAGQGISLLRREGVNFQLVTAESEMATRRLREDLGIEDAHTDYGVKEAERLLGKLSNDGYRPLWLASAGWEVTNRAGANLSSSFLPATNASDGLSARGDIYSVARMLKMAKGYQDDSHRIFVLAAMLQVILLVSSPWLNPLYAAIAGTLPGIFLLAQARRK